ncbi:MAG: TIGR01777 family oxidoreductase [Gammaproteobacteria bacterium]|nr:TIGR01777 family oxidoreductase [Gammaproteobacteria bacterium]
MDMMNWVLGLLIVQGILGAFDTLYHHELTIALPRRVTAKKELMIHSVRAILYGVVFAAIANLEFHGVWVVAILSLILIEIGLTLWDFVVEDNSRKLPASERVLHTVLAINGGALFGLYTFQLWQWSHLPPALVGVDYGWRSMALNLFAVGVLISGVRDGIAAIKLGSLKKMPNPFRNLKMQRVLVTGGTGFIGETLVNQLLDAGHEVTVWVRDPIRAAYLFTSRASCVSSLMQINPCKQFDLVINLAGAPVVGPRWNASRKKLLLSSRLDTTQELINWVKQAEIKPDTWIQASAIGYYGVRDESEQLSEDSKKGEGFMAELCDQWESLARSVDSLGLRRITLRFGLVFGPGGALPPLVLPHYFALGAKLGSGQQMMSWIHRQDLLKLFAEAITNHTMQGTYNAVAPDSISQSEFARAVAKKLKRPFWLTIPATPLRWLLGELAQLFADGQYVIPKRLQTENFTFDFPTLDSALEDLI